MVYPIIKRTIIPFVKLYIRRVDGIGNLPKKTGFVIASNHESYMDHMIISAIIILHYNQKLHFLAKKEHFDSLHQRIWHNYVGAIPLDREKGGKKALNTALSYLKRGKIIGIYPEGTRSLDGKLQRAHTGVARLALNARVPVVPIGLKGTFEILPKGKLLPKCRRATVTIGKPIQLKKYYRKENNKKALRQATNIIMRDIAKLCKKSYNFD